MRFLPSMAGTASGVASALAFVQQPLLSGASEVVNSPTGVRVAVEDSFGGVVTSDSSSVTLTLNGGVFASGANTATVAATDGVAVFNNLVISALGDYALTASDGSLAPVTSQNFTIANLPAELAFVQPPTNVDTGKVMTPAVTVAVQTITGLTVTSDTSSVTLTLNNGVFASGGSTITVAAVGGIATFSNLAIGAVGNYFFTASDGTLADATSSTFTVSLPPTVVSIARLSPSAQPPKLRA